MNINIVIFVMSKPGHSNSKVSSKDVNKDGVAGINGPNVTSTNNFIDHKDGNLQNLNDDLIRVTIIIMRLI